MRRAISFAIFLASFMSSPIVAERFIELKQENGEYNMTIIDTQSFFPYSIPDPNINVIWNGGIAEFVDNGTTYYAQNISFNGSIGAVIEIFNEHEQRSIFLEPKNNSKFRIMDDGILIPYNDAGLNS